MKAKSIYYIGVVVNNEVRLVTAINMHNKSAERKKRNTLFASEYGCGKYYRRSDIKQTQRVFNQK